MATSFTQQSENSRPATSARMQRLGFALGGAGLVGSFLYITTLSHYTLQGFDYLAGITLAFIFYVGLLGLLWKLPRLPLWWLFALGILCRVVLLADVPTLSSDVWRYLWDGRLINAGVNPYQYRVDDPALDWLRTPNSARIDHTRMATPYPPAAQVAFTATVAIQPESPQAMQVIFTLFDVGSAGLIVLLLRALNRPEQWVAIYLLNPLIITEFAHGAHVDSMMTFFILLALLAHHQQKPTYSSLALAVAVLSKYIPAILLPIFLRRWGVPYAVLFGLAVLLAVVPFLGAGLGIGEQDDGSGIFGAVRIYTNEWKTNDGFFYWLVVQLEPHTSAPIRMARSISNLLLLMAGGWVLLQTPADAALGRMVQNAAVLISVYLLLAAAMFPWYITWLLALLPLLPFHQKASTALFLSAWLYFSWAVQVSYLIYLDPANPREEMWMRYVQYGPLFALLTVALLLWLWEQWRGLSAITSPLAICAKHRP